MCLLAFLFLCWEIMIKCSISGETFIHISGFHNRNLKYYCLYRRVDTEGHCYIASLHIASLRSLDTGTYMLQLDNEEGGIKRTFTIIVTEALISDGVSIWFFALFFIALLLLVLNRFSSLTLRTKPIVSV